MANKKQQEVPMSENPLTTRYDFNLDLNKESILMGNHITDVILEGVDMAIHMKDLEKMIVPSAIVHTKF